MKASPVFFNATFAVVFATLFPTCLLFAGDAGKWYLGADAGVSLQQDTFTTFTFFPLNRELLSGESKFNPGEQVTLKIGYTLNTWLALELGAGFVHNSISSIGPDAVSDVDLNQVPIMVNFVLSRPIFHNWSVYAGGGAGGVLSLWDCGLVAKPVSFPNPPVIYPGHVSTETDFGFGYQFLAGVKYAVGGRWDFAVGYKFLSTTEGHNWTIGDANVKTDPTMSHSVFATLTYNF